MRINKEYLILFTILIIALYIRLSLLSLNRMHMDECLYSAYAMRIVDRGDIALNGGLKVDKPPLFFYFIALSFAITKIFSESSARLPNIIFSIITVFYFFKIITILYKNFHIAVLTAFFTAFSVYYIAFSVTAFQDISMTAFFVLSLYLILKEKYFLSAFFYAFSTGCKPMTLFLLPVYLLFIILVTEKPFNTLKHHYKSLIYGAICIFIPIILWSAFLANPRFGIFNFFISQQPEVMTFSYNYKERFIVWLDYSKNILNTPGFFYFAIAGLTFLITAGIFKKNNFLKIDLFFLTGIFYFYVLITFIKFRQFDRYLVPIVPFIALALARSINAIISILKNEKFKLIFTTIIMLFFYSYIYNIKTLCKGQGIFFQDANGFENIAEYLHLNQNNDTRIIYLGHTLSNYGFFYLYRTKFNSAISVFNIDDIEKNSKIGKNYIIVNTQQTSDKDLEFLNKKYKKIFQSGYVFSEIKKSFTYNYQIFEYIKLVSNR